MEEKNSQKKRKSRFSYINEYKKDAQGNYVFCGGYYEYANKEIARVSVLRRLWICLACALAVSVAGGCFPAAGSVDSFFVIIPYIAEICSLALCIWAALKYSTGGDPIKDYVYSSAKRLSGYGTAYAVSAAAGLVADAVYAAVCGTGGKTAGTAAYLVCKAAALAAAFFIINISRRFVYTEKKN